MPFNQSRPACSSARMRRLGAAGEVNQTGGPFWHSEDALVQATATDILPVANLVCYITYEYELPTSDHQELTMSILQHKQHIHTGVDGG